MARKYKSRIKRVAYQYYEQQSKELSARLKAGEMTQEQFERAHEMLDDKYRFVR